MGHGSWSDDDYDNRKRDRETKRKSAFAHSDDTMRTTPKEKWEVHPQLNPKGVTRESRDSANHPESLSIAVIFDVTGSMKDVPRILQKGLPKLMGLMLQKGWVEHPQILFGAVGDATCDRTPLQIGQFESDIAMENDLGHFLLEGGGGGQTTESYELAIYMASRHFSIDCFEKRKKKGYLFLIGDEMPYPHVKTDEVQSIIGDNMAESITIERIIQEIKEKYHIFMIRPTNTQWGQNEKVQQGWVSLLGQAYVVRLEYPDAISETIALITGITEGKITLDEGIKEIRNLGEATLSADIIESLARSLKTIQATPKQPTKIKTKMPTASTKELFKKKKPGRI